VSSEAREGGREIRGLSGLLNLLLTGSKHRYTVNTHPHEPRHERATIPIFLTCQRAVCNTI
jgi:hypothetical protein